MSKTYGLMVTKNEADRYLESSLAHNAPLLDGLMVFDDWSADRTVDIARHYADVVSRPRFSLSFAEHEGMFRRAAWDELVNFYEPVEDDVIVVVDADEYLIGDIGGFEGEAAKVSVDECWDRVVLNKTPMIRTDGHWGGIEGVRVWHWNEDLLNRRDEWALRKTASGCGPPERATTHHENLRILHVGYLDPGDRQAKYERYRTDRGHGSKHVHSIRSSPRLRAFNGEAPHIYRGTNGR